MVIHICSPRMSVLLLVLSSCNGTGCSARLLWEPLVLAGM